MRTVFLRTAPLVLALAASGLPLQAQPVAPAAATTSAPLTAAQWREDLRLMAAEMERRHKDLYHTVSRERFAAAVADLDARIPSLQRHEIIVGMMRIAAMVGDAHTNVSPLKDAKFAFPSLSLKLYLFEDGMYVRAAAPAHAALVGAKVEAIGGVPIAEAIRRAGEISPRDNEITPRMYAPIFLAMPHILHALGMVPSPDTAVLRLSKGKRRWTVTVPAGAVDPSWPPDTDISLVTPEGWVDSRGGAPLPLWLRAPLDYHRIVDLPERQALYVQLNMVTNVKGQTLAQFGRMIRQRAEKSNPRALILDVRLNRGGNGYLRHGLVRELVKAEDEDTRLFVLTWRGSFSATQFILDDLDRLTDARIIGEPASSKPNSFGDSYRITLPNSGLTVRTSIYWWQVEQEDRPWTPVDLATPLTFADYSAGRDPALEAALSYSPPTPLRERLVASGKAGGIEAVRAGLDSYLADPANRYRDLENDMALAAEALYAAGLSVESLAVAEMTAARFPDSPNAHNVLAHLAEAAGRTDRARVAAARTMALDPNHRVARSLLERLSGAAK